MVRKFGSTPVFGSGTMASWRELLYNLGMKYNISDNSPNHNSSNHGSYRCYHQHTRYKLIRFHSSFSIQRWPVICGRNMKAQDALLQRLIDTYPNDARTLFGPPAGPWSRTSFNEARRRGLGTLWIINIYTNCAPYLRAHSAATFIGARLNRC